MDEAQQILAGIPEAHAPAHAAFEIAGGAGHIEGDHALVLIPDVYHPVYLFVPGAGGVVGQQLGPLGFQGLLGPVKGIGGGVAGHHGIGPGLVDNAGGRELLLLGILNIAQPQENAPALAGGQLQVKFHGTHRSPAVGQGAGAFAVFHGLGHLGTAVDANKGIPGGIKAVEGDVGPQEGVVVPALPVFGLVIDGPVRYLHLAGGEIPLEVGGVVHGVPQAEFHVGEDGDFLGSISFVLHRQPQQQAVVPLGHQHLLGGGNGAQFPLNGGVAQAVAAGVAGKLGLGGLPAGVPDSALPVS